MSAHTYSVPRVIPEAVRHSAWFAAVCAVAFLVPYLGVSVLDLQHDVFYLVYFAVTSALVATYVRVEQVDVAAIFRGRWRWSLDQMEREARRAHEGGPLASSSGSSFVGFTERKLTAIPLN